MSALWRWSLATFDTSPRLMNVLHGPPSPFRSDHTSGYVLLGTCHRSTCCPRAAMRSSSLGCSPPSAHSCITQSVSQRAYASSYGTSCPSTCEETKGGGEVNT
ncbi:hypothetical protein Vretimale_8503 [Volvox reticuliferus]|uniref:Uncharacterized protein n=1 Tax=Volvox reticuliferus TaxID=1737510 RepID=A0A8J4GBI5_9CHLO|nr:hypothetical protein Vretimale_8503 [Volvox reticuliferus]